jgi:hypothetical protein
MTLIMPLSGVEARGRLHSRSLTRGCHASCDESLIGLGRCSNLLLVHRIDDDAQVFADPAA